jgi:hypothetical protein
MAVSIFILDYHFRINVVGVLLNGSRNLISGNRDDVTRLLDVPGALCSNVVAVPGRKVPFAIAISSRKKTNRRVLLQCFYSRKGPKTHVCI